MQLRETLITIPIRPKSAPRPRFKHKYGGYNDIKYTMYKDDVKRYMPKWLTDKKVHIETIFVFKMPNSWSLKRKNDMKGKFCDINKDIDNLEKSIFDAMNEHTFIDDRQIVSTVSTKRYGEKDKVVIKIIELGE